MPRIVRRLALVLVSAAIAGVAVSVAPPPVFAASPPTVSGVVTAGDPQRGDVTVTIFGTKLTSIKTAALVDVTNGGAETISVLGKTAGAITVKIPGDLTPGAYRFELTPKHGAVVTADYVVGAATGRFQGGAGEQSVLLARTSTGETALDLRDTGFFAVGDLLFATPAGIANINSNSVSVGLQFGGKHFYVNGPTIASTTVELVGTSTDFAPLRVSSQKFTGAFEVNETGLELSYGAASKPGGGAWAVFSDARLKKDVEPVTGALDKLLALRSVSFEYKDPAAIHELPGRQVGFIAQEVEKVLPGWVGERRDGMKFVAPKGFEALAVAALRELRSEKDAQIAALAAENEALRARLIDQESRLAAIEKAMAPRDASRSASGR